MADDKLAYSIPEVQAKAGLGRDTIYDAIRNGHLVARKHGRRTLILASELEAYLAQLPTFTPRPVT